MPLAVDRRGRRVHCALAVLQRAVLTQHHRRQPSVAGIICQLDRIRRAAVVDVTGPATAVQLAPIVMDEEMIDA